MNDLISVIVPVYNIEDKLLDKCINSIINQTYKNLEIIIVDDGSKKETADECDRLAKKDSRIVLIHQKNRGLSAARNVALDVAKGNYIGFVDSDDFIEPDMYELLYNSLVRNNADISVCGTRLVYKDGSHKDRTNYVDERVFSKCEAYKELLIDKEMTASSWNKLYRRYLFSDLRFPEGKTFEDRYIMHELFYMSEKISCVNKLLYNYYQRSNSILNSMTLDKFNDSFDAWIRRLEFTEKVYPDFNFLVYQSIIKSSIKYLLKFQYQKSVKLEEYKQKTAAVFVFLDSNLSREIVYNQIPKYKKDYDFLMKNRFSTLAKRLYAIKKRIFK